MREYLDLLQHIIQVGTLKRNRTGVDTISTFNYNYCIDLRHGFPLLTTKKINWKNILFENLWFLSGDSSADFLHKHGITFWDAWLEDILTTVWNDDTHSYESVPSGRKNLPQAYGQNWRDYPIDPEWEYHCDQFRNIIDGLKKDPNNRRLVLTNWYPPLAWSAKLPPCHLMAIFNVQWEYKYSDLDIREDEHRGKTICFSPAYKEMSSDPVLNLHMTQRSCDTMVGVPYNLAGYGFLLHLVSRLTGIQFGRFAHTLVDAHIYKPHEDAVKQQLSRDPRPLPKLIISDRIQTLEDVDNIIRDGSTEDIMSAFRIEGYNPHPFIKVDIAV